MQGLVLQLSRAGFLMLLWLFIWSVLRILRTDIYAPTGAVMVRRGLALRGLWVPDGFNLVNANSWLLRWMGSNDKTAPVRGDGYRRCRCWDVFQS